MGRKNLGKHRFREEYEDFLREGLISRDELVIKLLDALKFIREGYFEGAIRLLTEYINNLEALRCRHLLVLSKLANAYHTRGDVYSKRGKLNEALRDYEKAIEILEKIPKEKRNKYKNIRLELSSVYNNKGLVHFYRGELEEALKDISKAIKIAENKSPKKDKTKRDLITYYSNRANVYSLKRDIEKALEDYNKAIRLSIELLNSKYAPLVLIELVGIYTNRARLYDSINRLPEAIADLNKAIELLEKIPEKARDKDLWLLLALTHSKRGSTLFRLREFDKSEEELTKAIEIIERRLLKGVYEKPFQIVDVLARAYMFRANTRRYIGKKEEALRDYKKAIELIEELPDKSNPRIRQVLSRIYINAGIKLVEYNPLEAIRYLTKAIEIVESLPEKYKASNPEAIDDLAKAYHNRALAHLKIGHYDKAIEDSSKAIEIRKKLISKYSDPRYQLLIIKPLRTRAEVYIEKGAYDKALEDLLEAVEIVYSINIRSLTSDPLGLSILLKVMFDSVNIPVLNPDLIELFNGIINLAEKIPIKDERLGRLYLKIGDILDDLGKYEKAIEYLSKAIEILEKYDSIESKLELARAYNIRGNAHQDLGYYTLAINDFSKAIAIKEELLKEGVEEVIVRIANDYNNIGAVYGEIKEYDKAIEYFTKAIEILENLLEDVKKTPKVIGSLVNAYSNRGMAYIRKGEVEKGLKDLERAKEQLNTRKEIFSSSKYAIL